MTLQAFLIRQQQQQQPRKVLNATSRAVLVAQAWQRANGALWHTYGNNRGALREIGMMLSWISSQRQQWRHITDEIDTQHEIGMIYAQYGALLDQHDAIGYDDVALHVLDGALPALEYEYLVACELHHAQPSQLAVLSRYAAHYPMWLGGWVSHAEIIPEQRAFAQWLHQHAPPRNWHTPPTQGTHIVNQLAGTASTTPHVSMVGTRHKQQIPWQAGAATIVDECAAVANYCYDKLTQGHAVHVVCADERLVQHVRAAVIQRGIALPPLAPPDYINPIIGLARVALRWLECTDEAQQQALIQRILMMPFMGISAGNARQISRNLTHPETLKVRSWLNAIDTTQALAPQIRHILNHSGAIVWAWQSNAHTVDIRDTWLRDTRSWLERIEEIDTLAQQHQMSAQQREQLLLGVDALPTPMKELYRNTIPLTITAASGAHAANDCVVIMGLSEHIAPRATFGFQLIEEDTLCDVFRPERRPAKPLLTNPAVWQAREHRRFSSLVASHAQQVVLSFAQYGANGQAQLATPYLATLLNGLATFDRDGQVQVQHPAVTCVATLPIPQAQPTHIPTVHPLQLLTNNSFSASQISTYLNCPRRYYYEKVIQLGHDDESEVDERNLDMGSLAHEVLCAIMGTGATENVDLRHESLDAFQRRFAVMPQRLVHALQAAWDGATVELVGGGTYQASQPWKQRFGTGLRLHSNWRRIQSMMQRWWEYEQALYATYPHRRPLLLEHQLDFTIEGMRIMGRIDRIDAIHLGNTMRYEIIDYKSGKPKAYSELLYGFVVKEGKELSNFQIPLYLLGVNQPSWQLTPAADGLTLFYLGKSSDKNGQLRSISITDTATQIRTAGRSHVGIDVAASDLNGSIQQHLLRIMTQMRFAPYPTKPGRLCSYCPFIQICDDAQASA